jgi:hypothetical protein
MSDSSSRAGPLNRARAAAHLQDSLGGIDETAAEERVLREATA